MLQNRQSKPDRVKVQEGYQINLKSKLEIESLQKQLSKI